MGWIAQNFGTARGAVRLALSYPQSLPGLSPAMAPKGEVKRLVFVCHGNICRSAFADVKAQQLGLASASFGLRTGGTGGVAHPPALQAGKALGVDLAHHRVTDIADFVPQSGDLLLAMEVRQLTALSNDPRTGAHPRQLLGWHTSPPVPHLHDPYEMSDAYMLTCLSRISQAVEALALLYPGAKPS